jgi:hypothetical protein
MVKSGKSNNNRLQVCRMIDVPLHEVSGICLRRGRKGRMSLLFTAKQLGDLLVGLLADDRAEVLVAPFGPRGGLLLLRFWVFLERPIDVFFAREICPPRLGSS